MKKGPTTGPQGVLPLNLKALNTPCRTEIQPDTPGERLWSKAVRCTRDRGQQ